MATDDEDDSSDSSSRVPTKKWRSRVRVAVSRRERARMHNLNSAYDELRKVLPNRHSHSHNDRLSKITTLRLAIDYIATLTNYLKDNNVESCITQDKIENSAMIQDNNALPALAQRFDNVG